MYFLYCIIGNPVMYSIYCITQHTHKHTHKHKQKIQEKKL